jgi:hypothetical protein
MKTDYAKKGCGMRFLLLPLRPMCWLRSWLRRRNQRQIEDIANANEAARLHLAYWGE